MTAARALTKTALTLALAAALAFASGCGSSSSETDDIGGGGNGGGGDAGATDDSGGGGGDPQPGEVGGACLPDGSCDAGLECRNGVCGQSTTAGVGELGGPCGRNDSCDRGLVCQNSVCVTDDTGGNEGQEGEACLPDGSCLGELLCVADVCTQPGETGALGGPCGPGDICDPGLKCENGVCVEKDIGDFAWANPCTDLIAEPKTDGEACTDHCECASGYCYDEGYFNGDFRFCTRRCDGFEYECLTDDGVQTYVCLNFSGNWVDELDPAVHLKNFCVPACLNAAGCQAIDPAWDDCAMSTTWDGHYIGGRTCVVN